MHRTQFSFLLFVLFSLTLRAQYSSIELTEDQIKIIAENSKTATLNIVIENEKSAGDAAIVAAIKKYWKIGPYKFLSAGEFLDLKTKGNLTVGQIYLYEYYDDYSFGSLNTLQQMEFMKLAKTGVFRLAFPVTRIESKKNKMQSTTTYSLINIQFDLSSTMTSNKDKILDGYFDLMIKYFNNELNFCQKTSSVKDVKTENKNGIVYFGEGLKEVQERDILLVKEQVIRMKSTSVKDKKRLVAVDAVAQFNPPQKNVYTVFPDDISMAVQKADKKVLLYTNNMLLSASDGAVIAAPGYFGSMPVKRDYAFWLASFAIMALAFVIGTTSK